VARMGHGLGPDDSFNGAPIGPRVQSRCPWSGSRRPAPRRCLTVSPPLRRDSRGPTDGGPTTLPVEIVP
jgi:hypothetical protein